ncbi:MAG: hypothetical protein V4507_11760 [Verrucomicrobiota bacterium]
MNAASLHPLKESLRVGLQPQNILIPCHSGFLQGELTLPPDATGIVIFMHGSGAYRFRNCCIARALNSSGLGTLILNVLPFEEAITPETAKLESDVDLLYRQLLSTLHWIDNDNFFASLHKGFFGSSTEIETMVRVAGELDMNINVLVFRGGQTEFQEKAFIGVNDPTLFIVGKKEEEIPGLYKTLFSELSCKTSLELMHHAGYFFGESCSLENMSALTVKWFCHFLASHS